MNEQLLNLKQISEALDNIPSWHHLNVALTNVPFRSRPGGANGYRLEDAAKALAIFYRRMAAEYWKKAAKHYTAAWVAKARDYLDKAKKIEAIIDGWRTKDEDRQSIVQH